MLCGRTAVLASFVVAPFVGGRSDQNDPITSQILTTAKGVQRRA
jgi:hypothetical protein